jgi:hypothetical protein
MSLSVGEELRDKVRDAMDRITTEPVSWDVVGMPPQPQINQGQGGPVYMLSLTMKGALLGTEHHTGGLLVQAHNLTQELVDQIVRAAIEELHKARTAALTGETDQAPKSLITS